MLFACLLTVAGHAQQPVSDGAYWNTGLPITPFRLPLPPAGFTPEYLDLDGDGKPDAIRSVTSGGRPVLWLDDDGNMREGDLEGDMVNDCLLIDRHRSGRYDLVVKWADLDGDGHADLQLVADYPPAKSDTVWPNGHYMIVLDTDRDNVFNYIDWNTFQLSCWERFGLCDFLTDYSGRSAFLKMHVSTYDMADLGLNWENPFLFYDPDGDGLSEMAVRLLDTPPHLKGGPPNDYDHMQLTGRIDWVSIAVDLDNDNAPGNEFDFDFTLGFSGEGFDYTDQRHPLRNMRGLPQADRFFIDPRIRHLEELVYTGHDAALPLVFGRGKWSRATLVFDEDDDCKRWERVEFCEDRDPFRTGSWKGGFDHNSQSDPAGDRGEWDRDFSGGGKLYIGRFDGRLHLLGAEKGIWRIDQTARCYQGWDRRFQRSDPKQFATVRYTDRDGNGFFDCIEYDLDGDRVFETTVDLKALGVDDRCEVIDPSQCSYADYTRLMERMALGMERRGRQALRTAERYGLNTAWYAKLTEGRSLWEKYHHGYWLQFYLFKDLEHLFVSRNDSARLRALHRARYGGTWETLAQEEP